VVGFQKYPAIPSFILAKLKSVQDQNLLPNKFNYVLSRNFDQEHAKEQSITCRMENSTGKTQYCLQMENTKTALEMELLPQNPVESTLN
jgi:metal-sulfur cluster biosynthetic enzyme